MRKSLVLQTDTLRDEIRNAGLERLSQLQQEYLTHRAQVVCARNQLSDELGRLHRAHDEVEQECRCADHLLDVVMDTFRERFVEKQQG